jgi:RNase adaptor protein for sRNA GlmZ degradation
VTKVSVYTAGELHSYPQNVPAPDFTLNLSRLLNDPAHKPSGELLDMTGLDPQIREFVFAADKALELLDGAIDFALNATGDRPLTVAVLCRGGRHRSVAFAEELAKQLRTCDVEVDVTHLHKHLPRVIRQETAN